MLGKESFSAVVTKLPIVTECIDFEQVKGIGGGGGSQVKILI